MIRLERVYEIVNDGANERLVLRFSDEPTPDSIPEATRRTHLELPGGPAQPNVRSRMISKAQAIEK